MFAGKPIPRNSMAPTPCYRCQKIPYQIRRTLQPDTDGSQYAITPELRHRQAVEYHHECRCVNSWPDDLWVRRHAALIEPVFRKSERQPLEVLAGAVAALSARRN